MRGKRTIINVICSIFLQIVTIICGFIIPRLILEMYGSATNGLINSISQFLAYIMLFESGFGNVMKSMLYKPIAENNKKEIENILYSSQKFFNKIGIVFAIYVFILTIVYPLVVNTEFNSVYSISLIIILAISTFAESFLSITYIIFLQAKQESYIISSLHTISIILNAVITIILIKAGANIQIVKFTTALIFLIRPFIIKKYAEKKYGINLKNENKGYNIKQKWDGLAHHIAYSIHRNTDIIILTVFSNLKEVSVYSVYMLVLTSISNFITSLNGGIDAYFGNLIANNEKKLLNKQFEIYELIFHTISTIVYTCTLILIIPFISIYTFGIRDVNYIRPEFAVIAVIAEFLYAFRSPYNLIVFTAGHFKETKKGAWIEAITNIVISVILVWKFGLVGVAIGTLVAMTIRTIEIIYYSSKYILKRNVRKPFIRFVLIAVQMIIIILICNKIIDFNIINSYSEWIITAIKVVLISTIIIVPLNCIIYKQNTKDLINLVKDLIKQRNNKVGEKQ